MFFIQLIIFLFSGLLIGSANASVENYFEAIKSDPNALYSFFKEMPKGGELHYHLAGGAYPETMLDLAATQNYCLNTKTFAIHQAPESCRGVVSANLFSKPDFYNQTLEAWSMKNFIPGKESAHDHFFASFYKFMPVVADFRPELLAEVIKRAANQHELYLEIMVLADNAKSSQFGDLINRTSEWKDKHRLLMKNQDFRQNTQKTIAESKRILKKAYQNLHCGREKAPDACAVTVKFQYYILREQPLDNVFAQAVNAFEVASQSPDIVGINLVQAEDGIISLRDYKKQMEILGFLHQMYPDVHIALHAGELSPTAVAPKDLRFHIRDAIFSGHAERIGHGVDIAYENQAETLVQHMAKKPIPVEINLISNQIILDISGKSHPLGYYLAHNVPVVLSTDDEGVLRTDLTRQYVEAANKHGLDYPTIKYINRNALTYSFLPGASLWQDPQKQKLVKACQTLTSQTCQQFIKKNPKAQLQWQLERKLRQFEQTFLDYPSTRKPG